MISYISMAVSVIVLLFHIPPLLLTMRDAEGKDRILMFFMGIMWMLFRASFWGGFAYLILWLLSKLGGFIAGVFGF